MNTTTTSNPTLQSVQNGLRIIKLFTKEKSTWGISEAARELQLPKSTISWTFQILLQEGYVEKEGTKYKLGLSLLNIIGVLKFHMDIIREAKEPLQSLVDKYGESGILSHLEGTKVFNLMKIENSKYLQGDIGESYPAYSSSAGKIFLAHLSKNKVDEILKADMPKKGPNSITDPSLLRHQLEIIKQNGYCISTDEMYENVISIAAPIRDYLGEVIAGVTVIGPKNRIESKSIIAILDDVIKTAQVISYRLGFLESLHED